MTWQCRTSPTLGGGFAGTPNSAWGTVDYTNPLEPAVFFGVYGFPDLYAVRQHRGQKAVFWAGTDCTHLVNGYWLDKHGKYRLDPKVIGAFLNKECEHWCENDLERKELASVGIKAKVCPSYLGDVKSIEPTYKPSPSPKAYVSVSGDDFKAYGWDRLDALAKRMPHVTFYCYGNEKPYKFKRPNIYVRGRVSKQVMTDETELMQIAVRLNVHDGCSELVVEAGLRQQDIISVIDYPFLKMNRGDARRWLLNNLNQFPWVSK